jgi:hypothetical protein
MFRTNRPARYVEGGMIAMPTYPTIPNNLRNLNKRNNFPTNMLNKIRSRNWSKVSRKNVLKFVMYAYYMAHWAYRDTQDNQTRRQIHNFDNMYMRISTRQRGNHSVISPEILWNRLQRLTKNTLIEFARILEW